jgi:hypothetical protein
VRIILTDEEIKRILRISYKGEEYKWYLVTKKRLLNEKDVFWIFLEIWVEYFFSYVEFGKI